MGRLPQYLLSTFMFPRGSTLSIWGTLWASLYHCLNRSCYTQCFSLSDRHIVLTFVEHIYAPKMIYPRFYMVTRKTKSLVLCSFRTALLQNIYTNNYAHHGGFKNLLRLWSGTSLDNSEHITFSLRYGLYMCSYVACTCKNNQSCGSKAVGGVGGLGSSDSCEN